MIILTSMAQLQTKFPRQSVIIRNYKQNCLKSKLLDKIQNVHTTGAQWYSTYCPPAH